MTSDQDVDTFVDNVSNISVENQYDDLTSDIIDDDVSCSGTSVIYRDDLSDGVQEFLLTVREEAQQIVQHASTPINADYLETKNKNLNLNQNHPAPHVALKKRCGYLEHLLRLNGVGAPSKPDTLSCGIESDLSENELHWEVEAIHRFKEFRTVRRRHLLYLSQQYPQLAGEQPSHIPVERDWDESEWEKQIRSTEVTVSALGAMDSVRASAALEVIGSILNQNNKVLAKRKSVNRNGATPNGLTVPIKNEDSIDNVTPLELSRFILRRIMRWGFASLASLDELQALDADVAHSLQVVRRCCRWLQKEINECEVQTDAKLLEVIIQDFFRQR